MPMFLDAGLYENLGEGLKASYTAWTTSPTIGSFHFVADLPALFIIIDYGISIVE
jgi:hypothetical protein